MEDPEESSPQREEPEEEKHPPGNEPEQEAGEAPPLPRPVRAYPPRPRR